MPSFLELPAELRLIVYDHVLGENRHLRSSNKYRDTTYREYLQLAGVCRLMQKEVAHQFYARSTVQSMVSYKYVNHAQRRTISRPLYPLMESDKNCVLGYRATAEWLQACSEETIKGLHLIQIYFDQLCSSTRNAEDHVFDVDNASTWYESLVNVARNGVSFGYFEIDLKRCSFEGPMKRYGSEGPVLAFTRSSNRVYTIFEHPYLEACTAAIKEWVDELARETEGGRKPVTRKHLLKLFW